MIIHLKIKSQINWQLLKLILFFHYLSQYFEEIINLYKFNQASLYVLIISQIDLYDNEYF